MIAEYVNFTARRNELGSPDGKFDEKCGEFKPGILAGHTLQPLAMIAG
jgi:hypothetical protein